MTKKNKYKSSIYSLTSHNKKKKHKHYKINHTGIINGKESLYTHTVSRSDGKRADKRTCIYYDKLSEHCTNKKCSRIICTSAKDCGCYKRKEMNKPIKNSLSSYDETYLQEPQKASIHESNNMYISMSKNIGTPVHVGYMKSNDKRRHKARCIYYDKISKICKMFMFKCIGSSRCDKYKERDNNIE